MPRLVVIACTVAVLSHAVIVVAVTLRVPSEYPTIQSALDVAGNGDTVLIASGTYVESLNAPNVTNLAIRGEVNSDTLTDVRPIVDPTDLAGSNQLACLSLNGANTVVEDLIFRNGLAMHLDRPSGVVGGVRMSPSSPVLFRRCLFDSVCYALGPPALPVLEHCEFRLVQRQCVNNSSMKLAATDCVFSAQGFIVTRFGDSSTVRRCVFRDGNGTTTQFSAHGRGIVIEDCVFGPSGPYFIGAPFRIAATGELTFRRNVIAGNDNFPGEVGVMFSIECNCVDSVSIEDNQFTSNTNIGGFSIRCPLDDDGDPGRGDLGVIAGNRFGSSSSGPVCKAILLEGRADVTGNRFHNMIGAPAAVLSLWDSATVIRDNIFIRNEAGVASREMCDARFNFWGDNSGPYHPQRNPLGQGDAVGDSVEFDPWYPDSSFLETPPRTEPGVASYALRAFPNPFNARVTLKFEIPEPGIFRIELFNLLGRRVKELFVGPVAYEKIVRVDGHDLASGIYYARAWQTTHNRPVATAKLVLLK